MFWHHALSLQYLSGLLLKINFPYQNSFLGKVRTGGCHSILLRLKVLCLALGFVCCISDSVTIKGLINYHSSNSGNLSLLHAPLLGLLPFVRTDRLDQPAYKCNQKVLLYCE